MIAIVSNGTAAIRSEAYARLVLNVSYITASKFCNVNALSAYWPIFSTTVSWMNPLITAANGSQLKTHAPNCMNFAIAPKQRAPAIKPYRKTMTPNA